MQPSFLVANQSIGLPSESSEEGKKRGCLAFLQLVGTLYFKNNLATKGGGSIVRATKLEK